MLTKVLCCRALDLSQGRETPVNYPEPDRKLASLVSQLPLLARLDLSGTNLAGFQVPYSQSHQLSPGGEDQKSV